MQQHLTEQTVVYSAKSDTEKNFDFILPEYLPGISRIVKTYADIEKCIFEANSGEAEVKISVRVSVVYISEFDGKIKSTSFTEDISASMKEPFGFNGEYMAVPSCFVAALHSTVQSPRKVTVRLTLQTSVTLYSENKTPIYSPEEDDDICVLRDKVTSYSKKIIPETHFEQNEEISIDNKVAGIGEIIHTDASFIDSSITVDDGELKFNANVRLGILYESVKEDEEQDTTYSYLDTTITLSDTLHCENINHDDVPFIYIDIYSSEPSVSLDMYGENRVVSLTIKYAVTGFAYEKQDIELITDAFLQDCSSDPEFSVITVDKLHSHLSKKEAVSQSVHADIHEITDISACNAKINSVTIEHSQGQFYAAAKCLAEILGTNLSGELSSLDVPLLLHIPIGGRELASADSIPDVIINISGCSAQIKEGVLKFDFEVSVNGIFVVHESHNLVCSLSHDDMGKLCKNKGEIVIYYPSKDEDLWQIAKKYRVAPQKICDANGGDENSIKDRKTIIIP